MFIGLSAAVLENNSIVIVNANTFVNRKVVGELDLLDLNIEEY